MNKERQQYQGFTLLEMLVVLFIITLLMLLFIPNLSKQQEKIENNSTQALEKVIRTQTELYRISENINGDITYEKLQKQGYLTEEQVKEAKQKGITIK